MPAGQPGGAAHTEDSGNSQEWLAFRIGSERYCHPVSAVREVLRYQPPVPVPGAPPFVLGITNVRGEIMTVVDGRRLVDAPETEPGEDSRVITMEFAGEPYGLLVDAVSEILHFRPEELDERAGGSAEDGTDLIRGVFQRREGLVIAIDLSPLIHRASQRGHHP